MTMHYPLSEEIGAPELFVGRKKEFAMLDEWIEQIPKRLGKSKALFSRKKGGKTSLVQRLFNRLWSDNGPVIPIFFSIPERSIWLPDFAIQYYCIFASQYIAFLDRNESLVGYPLSLKEIHEYGKNKSIQPFVRDTNYLQENKEQELYDSMWETACSAPKRFAHYFDQRFVIIIDEFQFLSHYVTIDPQKNFHINPCPAAIINCQNPR
ncbi:MAG: hypothetical protein OMM_05451 [Candidatus Magnetoglobus multicellularis str. Araruama]|uniref:ATPase domain-containing protein n=1 Tax=Candidatus Magnetoglobus multicellularis str. Araruama TaxID=890399 RepID=A0A1V1NWD2_9BACT|nr:MAG: hypothetical protein OMM_05451 [Candidatus Magnetoglobus multicellularis str. Araruama]